jgi:3'-phosphoadenosine 5'-phosphosulfate sulfotransferase (PAPS reductase)/FAD synthetase
MNIKNSNEIIVEAIEKYNPVKILLLFSGGHDSLTSTHYAASFLKSIGKDFTVYHGNTGIGIKETREFVYSVVKKYGWNFYEGHPPNKTYEELVKNGGFPGPSLHYLMYSYLKERALRKYVTHTCKSSPRSRENVLLITGIRKSESKIRMGYKEYTRKDNSRIWCSPIFFWDKEKCETYMKDNELPRNPVKDKICISGECLCGAFAGNEEWAEIKYSFPEAAKEIERLHKIAIEQGFPWGWASCPKDYYKNNPPKQTNMFMCVGCEEKNLTINAAELKSVSSR